MKPLQLVIVLLIINTLQNGAFSQNSSPETIVRLVAKKAIESTSRSFINARTKEKILLETSSQINSDVRVESGYNRWEYVNGVFAMGLVRMTEVFKDTQYINYANENFEFCFRNLPLFKTAYMQQQRVEWEAYYRMDRLDDCGAIAASLADLNSIKKNKNYEDYLVRTVDHILQKQSRLKDGTLSRKEPHNMTIWADDLYMSVPFLARMGKYTGNQKYFDEAIKQVENFNRYLFDNSSGIYWHCWYQNEKQNGVAHWLRCNGWVAMAQTELLDCLPKNHPKRKIIISLLQRQITGFSRYQDISGLWRQVIDRQDSYLETSGTAMFVYAVAKAVNEGWINSSYLSIAENGWQGLASKITSDGLVQDVCVGTNIKDDIKFYLTRPKKLNDNHALGAVLLAGTEMMRIKKK
jgi:unsaturated rhamnogalacturonyl hydrolase